ncbi:hypothetical protein [Oribacterium sp. FC2011]|uniref:hypothetical protein n=1 Tax=Oribacterium sp. FC2011 TaxID=1408311 RepID=UPI0004E156EF|nr:hypothetical protein [Oribacterium sp. FC2011]
MTRSNLMRFLVCAVSCSLLAGCGSVSNTAESSITEQESVEENKETSGDAEAESSESDATQEKNTDTSMEEKTSDKNDGTANSNAENKSLAKRLAGKYSYHYGSENGDDEYYIMDIVPFGDNLYAYCGQAMAEDTESLNAYSFWACEFIPNDPEDLKSEYRDMVTVNELRFSVMSNAGLYWDQGQKGTITLTDEGILFEGFEQDDFLVPENDDSRLFLNDDRVEDAFVYLKRDAEGGAKELNGLWILDNADGADLYLEFTGSDLYMYKKDPGSEVFYAAGGCEYGNETFSCQANRLGYGGMPFEMTCGYKVSGDDLTLKIENSEFPDVLPENGKYKRVNDGNVHVTSMDEVVKKAGKDSEPGSADLAAYEALYSPVLEEVREVVTNGYDHDKEYKYVSNGLMEKCMYPGDDDLTKAVGYVLKDVSRDGIPELIIGCDEKYGDNEPRSYIFNLFTLKDDEVQSVFDGWARSSYQWMGDDHFYYSGSGGAAITIFGENHLSPDGTEIVWDDFYFSDEKEVGNIGLYHNTSGIFDAGKAEELDMSDSEFFDKMDDYESKCQMLSWTPVGKS